MKVKFILALSIVLVVGLVSGFFIGFGVTNKDLNVDWKAITPIFSGIIASTVAATIALYISNKWNKQKGSELIANESKKVIMDILELLRIINYIERGLVRSGDLNREFEKFVDLYESVVLNTSFIENCLVDSELKINFESFAEKSLKVKDTMKEDKKKLGDKELTVAVKDFNKDATKLVNTLNPYSVFRKECKFELEMNKITTE